MKDQEKANDFNSWQQKNFGGKVKYKIYCYFISKSPQQTLKCSHDESDEPVSFFSHVPYKDISKSFYISNRECFVLYCIVLTVRI